jgi:hypothetical protein
MTGPRFTIRTIVLLIAMAICIAAVVAVLVALDARKDTARAKAAGVIADGRTGAAQDASGVRDRSDLRDAGISADVKQGTDDVRKATDRAAANRAARRGVCRIDASAYADCGVLLADPG